MTNEWHQDQELARHTLTNTEWTRWWLREVRGISVARIADTLAVSESAVKESLRSARRKLDKAKEEAA